MPNALPPVPPIGKDGFSDPVWARWLNLLRAQITSVSTAFAISTANGFQGSATTVGGTTTITLETTVVGIIKGSGGGLVAAIAGTDYIHTLTCTAPLGRTGTDPVVLSIAQATSVSNGYLTASDWLAFNGKISGNQNITLTGDVTGSGTTGIATTLSATGVTAGAYGSGTVVPQITVDAKGRVTAITNVAVAPPTPGYGTTAARPATPALGFNYFDTTIAQPIWCKSLGPTVWVNAAGVVV